MTSAVLFSNQHYVSPGGSHSESPHSCILFDMPNLLFDKRWLGTDAMSIELTGAAESPAKALIQFQKVFEQTGLRGNLALDGSSIRISNLSFSGQVDPAPLMDLAVLCLWVKPNRVTKLSPSEAVTSLRCTTATERARVATLINEEIMKCQADQKLVIAKYKEVQKSSAAGSGDSAKGTDIFKRIEKVRIQLQALLQRNIATVEQLDFCTVCERVVGIYSSPTEETPSTEEAPASAGSEAATLSAVLCVSNSQETASAMDELAERILKLDTQIRAASGQENKQKRKRLQRKRKELKDQQARLLGSHMRLQSREAPAPGGDDEEVDI